MDGSSPVIEILILILLLILSAFFSSAETAFTTINKIQIRHLKESGVKGSERVERILENQDKLLATILVGNNLVNIAASSLATIIAIDVTKHLGAASYAIAISTGIMTFLILVFGEITPKTLAKRENEKFAIFSGGIIEFLIKVFSPIVFIITVFSRAIIKIFRVDLTRVEPYITEDELKTIVNVSEEEGVLEVDEKEMIYNVFELKDTFVKEIMVQRVDIVSLEIDDSYEKVRETINRERLSRMPVYKESIDNVVGILNVKDLVLLEEDDKKTFSIKKYMRDPIYTYEFKKIMDLFKEMKNDKNHMAVVLDEYGGTVGIATMEDLIEEIVGEIDDEYDEDRNEIQQLPDNEYVVSGGLKIEEVNELLNINIESEEFDTLGGFLIEQTGKIPKVQCEIIYENIKFIPVEISKNRILKVKISI